MCTRAVRVRVQYHFHFNTSAVTPSFHRPLKSTGAGAKLMLNNSQGTVRFSSGSNNEIGGDEHGCYALSRCSPSHHYPSRHR